MLGGLLGGKFSNKCKHGVKCIRTRLVPIRNRKQSMIRILRKDVADLLTAGHDRDAFRRIDVLMAEINHRACYDMIEKSCEFLLSQLPSMQKQRECSQEVTETMATIIFAAARFADLPELCDLRTLFIQRYGSDMQSFVNAEFVDKIQTKTFPIKKKLQLMKDIADEFSVKWESNPFNHELSSSPALKFNQSKESMSSKVDVRHTPAMLDEPKEISSGGLHFTTADAGRRQQTLMPNGAHVFSAAKINQIYDPKMRTRKVTAYESVTADIYEEDRVHDDVNSRSNHVRKHDDGKPKSATCHSRKLEVEDEKQYCIDSEVQRVGTLKSLNDEPDNLVPPYTKSNGNKSGYNRIEGTALPPLYTKVDRPKNAFPVIKRSPSNLESSRQMSVEEGLDPVGEDLKQVRSEKKGLLANMDPPYVKLKDRGSPAHIDPLIQNSDSVDHVRSNETGARCSGNEDNERPKPFSVKKNFHSRPTIETDDNNLEKPNQDASTDGRWRNKSNRRTSGYGNNANYDEDNATTSKASKSPIRGEMADVLDYGRPLPRTSSVERRHGSRSSAVIHDSMENDENIYGKYDTHPSVVGRNHRSKQGNEAYAGIFNEERITGSNGSKQPIEDELDNAIDYGNLFRRTSHRQREHRSIRHPAAVHHVEYEHDEQEMAMDRLVTHLSRKGTTKVHIKDRRSRIVPGNYAVDGDSTEHHGEVLHVDRSDSVSTLERTRSMQPEPVSVSASKPSTRAASMQSHLSNLNYGRVHQRTPDYDQMVARFAAFRQS